MTKKELIEVLEDIPDNFEIGVFTLSGDFRINRVFKPIDKQGSIDYYQALIVPEYYKYESIP